MDKSKAGHAVLTDKDDPSSDSKNGVANLKETDKFFTEELVLDHYQCTFFLPLIGLETAGFEPCEFLAHQYKSEASDLPKKKPEDMSPKEIEEEREAQAYYYFSPALRDILFDIKRTNNTLNPNDERLLVPIKEWRISEDVVKNWSLHLGRAPNENNDYADYQEAKFCSLNLYRYFNGVYVLAFRVKPAVLDELKSDNPLFCAHHSGKIDDLIKSSPKNKAQYLKLKLEAWLRFTRLARTLYPAYPEQQDEGKIAPIRLYAAKHDNPLATAFDTVHKQTIPKHVGDTISPVVVYLLQRFARYPAQVPNLLKQYNKLYDDRMFVSVTYGIAGKQQSQAALDKIFHLALYGDRHADTWRELGGHAYTHHVTTAMSETKRFDLWSGMGGYYGFSDSTNVYLYRGSFFRTHISEAHVAYIYNRMLLQALLYQASLRHYDHEIATSTQRLLAKNDLNSIRQQRKNFITFTNRYWFHEVTEQLQGKMIFELQQQSLNLTQQHDVIKDELEQSHEYIQTRLAYNVSHKGFYIAVTALLLSAFAAMPSDLKQALWEKLLNTVMAKSVLMWLPSPWRDLAVYCGLIGVLLAVVILVLCLIRMWRS